MNARAAEPWEHAVMVAIGRGVGAAVRYIGRRFDPEHAPRTAFGCLTAAIVTIGLLGGYAVSAGEFALAFGAAGALAAMSAAAAAVDAMYVMCRDARGALSELAPLADGGLITASQAPVREDGDGPATLLMPTVRAGAMTPVVMDETQIRVRDDTYRSGNVFPDPAAGGDGPARDRG